jgi:hypothetical protein
VNSHTFVSSGLLPVGSVSLLLRQAIDWVYEGLNIANDKFGKVNEDSRNNRDHKQRWTNILVLLEHFLLDNFSTPTTWLIDVSRFVHACAVGPGDATRQSSATTYEVSDWKLSLRY